MNFKPAGRWILAFILVPHLLPLIYWYFTNLDYVALWLWIWFCSFAWVIFSKAEFEFKGLTFLVLSVAIGVCGKGYFVGEVYEETFLTVELLSQIMIVTGSGVGGNLIAYWMIEAQKIKKSK